MADLIKDDNASKNDKSIEMLERQPCDKTKETEASWIRKVKESRKRYSSTFTMHAVEHVINGTKVERIFWSFMLCVALSAGIGLSYKLFASFSSMKLKQR